MAIPKSNYHIVNKWILVYQDDQYVYIGYIKDNWVGTILTVEVFDSESEVLERVDELGLTPMFNPYEPVG